MHVSGHPRRGELRQLYDWLKPSILVPVHGEAAHLEAQAELGREAGIEKVLSIRNGDMAMLYPTAERFVDEVPSGRVYLDGDILCTPDESGVRERRKLGFGGFIAVSMVVDGKGQMREAPQVELYGLPQLEDEDEDFDLVVDKAIDG